MDPNATLRMIEEALRDRDYRLANQLKWSLFQWLARGGFEPDWSKYPQASAYYHKRFPRRNPRHNPLRLSSIFSGPNTDQNLRVFFSWLTRIGAGPKFGSRPIGWYQLHMMKAYDILRATGADEVKFENGRILGMIEGEWTTLFTPSRLYELADIGTRNNPLRMNPGRRRNPHIHRIGATVTGPEVRTNPANAVIGPYSEYAVAQERAMKLKSAGIAKNIRIDKKKGKWFVSYVDTAAMSSLDDWKRETGDYIRGNPPRTKIYQRTIEIVASKAGMPHKCDAACKRAGHKYRHVFKDRNSSIHGLENGKIVIG